MSIDRWNRDDSVRKCIDEIEKNISHTFGKEAECGININAQAASDSLRETIISAAEEWAENNKRPGGMLYR